MIATLRHGNATPSPEGAQAARKRAAVLVVAIALVTASAGGALAGTTTSTPAATPLPTVTSKPAGSLASGSYYDHIWGLAKLYNDPENPWIQDFSIVGRQQFDLYYVDSDQGDADDFVSRRTRIGAKANVLRTLTLHSEVDLNLEKEGETYNKLTDAYVKWSPDARFNLTVGKQRAKFTLDGTTSSTELITIDRSNLANNVWFTEEFMPGVGVNGAVGKLSYNGGYFSSGEENAEFGDLSAGSFLLLSGGYDLAEQLDTDKALARLDYVWQDQNSGNDFTRSFDHVASLNFQAERGRWGLATDLAYAAGYGSQSDLVGGQAVPSVKFCATWQGVLRYTGISSEDDNGIRFARYEDRVVSGRGDEYQEIYLGLNKYFYGHKFKWQSGIQYAWMDDSADDGGEYEGWGLTTGLRASW